MKNIYVDHLDSFSFDEMLGAMQAISQETHRLDFKRIEVGRPKLAHLACAFANADGGVIAIGFHDPNAEAVVTLADPVDITDKAQTALAAAINARVHPPLPIELCGYASTQGQRFLILRIDRSDSAPHEYIYPDLKPNLPVRRDTSTGSLSLAEIDALRTRGQEAPPGSPLGQKPHPQIWIGPGNTTADLSFGIRVAPQDYARQRVILDPEDDQALADIVDEGRGQHRAFFRNLPGHTLLDGIHFYEGPQPSWIEQSTTGSVTRFAPEQVSIDSDGEITLRFLQNDQRPLFQYLAALAAAYLITQGVFFHFKLAPFANVYVRLQLDERRLADQHGLVLPQYYEDRLTVDLAVESFTEAFLLTTVRMLRATGATQTTEFVRELLERFERDNVRELRTLWN